MQNLEAQDLVRIHFLKYIRKMQYNAHKKNHSFAPKCPAIQIACTAAASLRRSAAGVQRSRTESTRANHGRTEAARRPVGAAHISGQRTGVQHPGHQREGHPDVDLTGRHRHHIDACAGHAALLDEFAEVSVRRANVPHDLRELYVRDNGTE